MKPDKLLRLIDQQKVVYTSEDGKMYSNGDLKIPVELLKRETRQYVPEEWLELSNQWWDYLGYDKRSDIIHQYFDSETIIDCNYSRNYYLNISSIRIFYFWANHDFPVLEITYPFK
jgi:hypothetical protein